MLKLTNICTNIIKLRYKVIIKIIMIITMIFILLKAITPNMINTNLVDNSKVSSYVKMGIYDENEAIIDNGSNIIVEKDTIIENTLIINHENIPQKDYMLIIFIDFMQKPFKIDGKEYKNYIFEVGEDSEVRLDIEVNIESDAKEIDYIVVKKPSYIDKELDLKKLLSLSDVFSCRYTINSNSNVYVDYDKNIIPIKNEILSDIFLSKEADILKHYTSEKELETTYISIGSIYENQTSYAIIALLDWKQVPFEDGSFVKYVKLNKNEKVIYEYEFPDVSKDVNFQVIAFPKPFNINENSAIDIFPIGSTRVIVENVK